MEIHILNPINKAIKTKIAIKIYHMVLSLIEGMRFFGDVFYI